MGHILGNNVEKHHTIYKTNGFFGVLLLALILRLTWSFFIPVHPVSDSVMYDVFAQSISQGNGYAYPDGQLTAYWPVGTSAIYAALYSIFGHTYTAIVGFNIIIGLLTTGLIMLLGEHWLNKRSAFYAGVLYALWPSQIQFSTVLASELIFNCFILFGLFFWSKFVSKNYITLILSATFFAFACYVRPIALLIPPIQIAINLLKNRSILKATKSTICIGIVMTIIIAPWSLRNYHAFYDFILISTNGSPVLWMGNNPDSTGEYMPLPELTFKSEVDRSNYFKQKAIEHIKDEPALFLKRCLKRLVDYYKSETIGVHWNITGIKKTLGEKWLLPLKIQSTAYWSLMILLSIFGAYYYIKDSTSDKKYLENPMFALIIYFTSIHMIIASGDRYHFPIIPFLAIFSGYYLSKMHALIADRRH